jgi:hypothetical protein
VIWFEATCWLLPVTKLIITGDGPGDVDQVGKPAAFSYCV